MSFIERYLNRKILFELAPGAIFFIINYGWGLMWATAAVMAATGVFTFLGIALEKKVPVFPIVTVIMVLVLGGATLLLDNELFIKIKPTVGTGMFAAILITGLIFRPPFLARALEGQVFLSEKGWKVLTVRWVVFMVVLALMNEIVWRTQDTAVWAGFKALLTPVSIVGCIFITRITALAYWQAPRDRDQT